MNNVMVLIIYLIKDVVYSGTQGLIHIKFNIISKKISIPINIYKMNNCRYNIRDFSIIKCKKTF